MAHKGRKIEGKSTRKVRVSVGVLDRLFIGDDTHDLKINPLTLLIFAVTQIETFCACGSLYLEAIENPRFHRVT